MKKLPGTMPPDDEAGHCKELRENFMKKLRWSRSTDEASTIVPDSDDDGVMSDGSKTSVIETVTTSKHSNTRSAYGKGPGHRTAKNLRAQLHRQAQTGKPGFSLEENKLRQDQKTVLSLFHPSGSAPQGLSALQTHSEIIGTMKALGDVSKEDMVENFLKLMEPFIKSLVEAGVEGPCSPDSGAHQVRVTCKQVSQNTPGLEMLVLDLMSAQCKSFLLAQEEVCMCTLHSCWLWPLRR
jgi:hypothetical protein